MFNIFILYIYIIYIFYSPGVDPALQKESRPQMPVPSAAPASASSSSSSSSSSKFHRARSGGARDERYRSGKGGRIPWIPLKESKLSSVCLGGFLE